MIGKVVEFYDYFGIEKCLCFVERTLFLWELFFVLCFFRHQYYYNKFHIDLIITIRLLRFSPIEFVLLQTFLQICLRILPICLQIFLQFFLQICLQIFLQFFLQIFLPIFLQVVIQVVKLLVLLFWFLKFYFIWYLP